jgi:hypothetical protein
LQTSNLILDFEFDQHLESPKHVINIIMGFRDMRCYNRAGVCHLVLDRGRGRVERHGAEGVGDELRGRDRGRRRWHTLTDSCSRLPQGDGLGLLLEEEAGGLDTTTGSGGLRLGVLGLLDDGLESSTEDSSLDVVRHGNRIG